MKRSEKIDYIKGLWLPNGSREGREMLLTAICRVWEYLPDEVIDELYNIEYYEENKS